MKVETQIYYISLNLKELIKIDHILKLKFRNKREGKKGIKNRKKLRIPQAILIIF